MFFFAVLFVAAAAVFAFFFNFSCVVIVVVFFYVSCMLEITVNCFELVPAACFTCASVASLILLCCCVHLTTRSLSFISTFLSRLSTAHSRCDEFFWLPFFHLAFDFCFDVLVFGVLEASALACFSSQSGL